jgi:hypothetical protein
MTLRRQNFQEKVALWRKNSVSVAHNAKLHLGVFGIKNIYLLKIIKKIVFFC